MDNQANSSQEYFWNLFSKKLSLEATAEELNEFESFLLHNPDLQLQVEMISQMMQQRPEQVADWSESAYMRHLMDYKDDFFPEGITDEKHNTASEQTRYFLVFRRIILNKITLVVAGLVILFASWKVFLDKKNPGGKILAEVISSVTTKYGNRTKITLPDGTIVSLNAGSKLDYNPSLFNRELREIYLSGEAFFEVVKNTKKPFIVHTENMLVTVLGTSFNLKSYPGENQSEASLIKGSIEVTTPLRPQEKYILRPDEKFVISNTNIIVKKPAGRDIIEKPAIKEPEAIISIKKVNYVPEKNIIVETAWVNNRLEFRSEPFQEVAKKMERWYDVSISFNGNKISDRILTGSFENETIAQALEALKIAESFNYIIKGKNIIIKP